MIALRSHSLFRSIAPVKLIRTDWSGFQISALRARLLHSQTP